MDPNSAHTLAESPPQGSELGDTVASRGPVSAENPVPAASRHVTVLPKVAWNGEQPQLHSTARPRYEEVRPLGQGGMGEVVLVKDHDIDRHVALKRLPSGCDAGQVVRFVDEVRAVGSLEHPSIVPIHDVGVDADGRYFFVMKALQGETLEQVIAKLKAKDPKALERWPMQARARLIFQVLQAISYAHRQGWVHRDLKPANIMVGPFGEVTVMDWGLAKRLKTPDQPAAAGPGVQRTGVLETRAGAIMGTPLYMSPEQAAGRTAEIDQRSDIYSLGVMFHELLNLQHYLEKKQSLQEVLQGVQDTPVPHPSVASGAAFKVPIELQWIIDKAVEKAPARRYQSVDEMVAALQAALDGVFKVVCARTLAKRTALGMAQGLDRYPRLFMLLVYLGPLLALAGGVSLVMAMLR